MSSSSEQLHNSIVDLKIQAKLHRKEAEKCLAAAARLCESARKKLAARLEEEAKSYAEQSIAQKNAAATYNSLAGRIETSVMKLEVLVRTRMVAGSFNKINGIISEVCKPESTERVTKCMDQFEQAMEDLEVQSKVVNASMSKATASSAPSGEVEALLNGMREAQHLEVTEKMTSLSVVSTPAAAASEESLDARLEKLKTY